VDLLMSEFEKYRLGTRGERREEVTQGEDRQMSKPTSSARTAIRPTTMNARSRLKGTTYLELAQPSPFTKTPTSAKPPSPMKPGLAPRIGLRSHNTPTPSTQKAFRPPLLAPQGPRSSPRRTTPNPPSTKRPIRGPSTPTMRSDVSKTNTDPSSDGLGEESFDSFDGMFQDGGAEIEELLRKVDGSQ